VDAEVMLKRLADDGFERTEDAAEADLIIVNTCGFIEKARRRAFPRSFRAQAQSDGESHRRRMSGPAVQQ
jgi:ribosomal protein S12 methylthiotransferase